jgi:hypothetical protein
MTTTYRLTGILVIAMAALIAVLGFGSAPRASAAGADNDGQRTVNGLAVQGGEPAAGTLIILVTPRVDPKPGELTAGEVYLEDFYCGGRNQVACDETFSDFCAKIAHGKEIDLDSGGGACITPGGVNPDGAP